MDKKKGAVGTLLEYAGSYRSLSYLGLFLSAAAMILGMLPYVCIWLSVKELISVAPMWGAAVNLKSYAWTAFAAAVAGIIVYFIALMCTHLAAFRTAENIRKAGIRRLMQAPLGYFDKNASGLLRNKLDNAAADTETLLAHNLADVVGTIAMFIAMLVLMLVFDWRMGIACLMSAVISVLSMMTMMTGKNAQLIKEHQAAQDHINKAATEYVRGIPVVKIFQQTVHSFRAFREAIDDYSDKAKLFSVDVCRVPQSINLTFTEGAFVLLIPAVLLLAPGEIGSGRIAEFITNFVFYAVFSAIISTALARVMFAASGMMLADAALTRLAPVMEAPVLAEPLEGKSPADNSIELCDVSFSYEGTDIPALSHVSFRAEPGECIALVGPSGGGKTTAASLIPRFWDAASGTVKLGGVDVREITSRELMGKIAFVFQNDRLFSKSIFENVRMARPEASREEVLEALEAAQCRDILDKLPDGMDTVLGTDGTYLSGGEKQRVSLARAILKDAPVVVLDEATAFADPENEALIQRGLERLMKGRTVVMIAHRLSTVVGADRIVVLDKGNVVEQGRHEELAEAGGLYARMWADYQKSVRWRIVS